MPLGQAYESEDCPIASALELIGERWTLLIIRDCFLGIRHFRDYYTHLDISKALLSNRLKKLVKKGILEKQEVSPGKYEYTLTARGKSLWPIIFGLAEWGDRHFTPEKGRRRYFSHISCGTTLDQNGQCNACSITPEPEYIQIIIGPGANPEIKDDPVNLASLKKHRILEPLPYQENSRTKKQ